MAYTTINKSSDYQNTVLYTGNAGTQSITGVGFQPDLNWIKCRGAAENHVLSDSVRGDSGAASGYYTLNSNSDAVSSSGSGNAYVTALGSDGFSIGNNDQVNVAQPFASWNWKAGTTSGITTNGSTTITPTGYSFNATSGFSIVKFTGNATSAQKIPHGLGAVPKFMMLKRLGSADDWYVYHYDISANPSSEFLILNTTAAVGNSGGAWSDTEPDSVNFTVGSRTNVNGTDGMIAYCFAPITGYSKFGSYKGNGNVDGPFCFTGFKPSFVIMKRTDSTGNWSMFDNRRTGTTTGSTIGKANPSGLLIHPDLSNAEVNVASGGYDIDTLSNGFKLRNASGGYNTSGGTYIYMAFGQSLVGSNNVPCTAR